MDNSGNRVIAEMARGVQRRRTTRPPYDTLNPRPSAVVQDSGVAVPDHTPPPPPSDEELLARLRDGDRDAFAPLVRRYERELFGYLRRYVGDDDLADDVFQNTFLQVFL